MPKKENYYKLLGVAENASMDDIKKEYRKLAVQWHPDKNLKNQEFAAERFKLLSEAYNTLSDPSKRQEYDESLREKFYIQKFDMGDGFDNIFWKSGMDITGSNFFADEFLFKDLTSFINSSRTSYNPADVIFSSNTKVTSGNKSSVTKTYTKKGSNGKSVTKVTTTVYTNDSSAPTTSGFRNQGSNSSFSYLRDGFSNFYN